MQKLFGSIAVVALLAVTGTAHAAPFTLRFIGVQTLPNAAQFDGTTIGGLSGIDYDAATDRYTVISDDRSQLNPARFYEFDLDYTTQAFTAVTPLSTTVILRPDGTPFPALSVDPESIRRTPTGTLAWTSEGDANALLAPTVREMGLDGGYIRDFTVPAKYDPTADNSSGIRNNLAFESLTFTPDGASLFTATEGALNQDGPASTLAMGSPVRFLQFDAASGAAAAEFVYSLDPIVAAAVPPGGFAVNGLVELLALSDTTFLAVERSFSVGVGNSIRLFHVDIAGATDVLGFASLSGQTYTEASKTLLLDLGGLGFALDNIEGISLGRTLENGLPSLVLVADDNFSPTQAQQFLAFELRGVPEPASWALMVAGFGLVGRTLRRRRLAVVCG